MVLMIIFAAILALLFALAYSTKRRFGMLGLALCAGALLSMSWTGSLTPFLQAQGIDFTSPPLEAVVAATLTILPALFVLMKGPTYKKPLPQLVSAIGFTLFALILLLKPLGPSLPLPSSQQGLYTAIVGFSNASIVIGVLIALGDIVLHRPGKKKSSTLH
jgi:hypothetical protein